MREDFCAFILTHGRPDRVVTVRAMERAGYTGDYYIVIDNEDPTAPEYYKRYGDKVIMFDKVAVQKTFDDADNFEHKRGIVYARNVCFQLAKERGYRYFVELDDDYNSFFYRYDSNYHHGSYRIKSTMDDLLAALVGFLESTPALTIAMSQGGDHIGGASTIAIKRKAMNSFVCDVEKPFTFFGKINEDVNTYVLTGGRGGLFFTVMQAQLNQAQTQANSGGMTELYLDVGTYVKSFYTIIMNPSCTKIAMLQDPRSPHARIHHSINWARAVPCILSAEQKK